jgi:proline iminopeptidase
MVPAILMAPILAHPYRNDFKSPYPPSVTIENPKLRRTTLYPSIEPYKTGMLKVSDLHTLYYEECGNPNGKPVVILHGGPGGGINADMRSYHDPKKYRIILFDQR